MSRLERATRRETAGETGPIAVVTALPQELAPLVARLRRPEVERLGRLRLHRGTLSGRRVVLFATGDGPISAERGLSTALEALSVAAVFGIGVAGGLSADLAIGDEVLARRVMDSDESRYEPPPWRWSASAAGAVDRRGSVVCTRDVVVTAAAKRRLWRRSGSPESAVVDLESAAWARVAAAAGLPWLVLRAVIDPAAEDLPLDFNRFRGSDGRIQGSRLATHVLAHPGLIQPLGELRARLGRCAKGLADRVEEILEW